MFYWGYFESFDLLSTQKPLKRGFNCGTNVEEVIEETNKTFRAGALLPLL